MSPRIAIAAVAGLVIAAFSGVAAAQTFAGDGRFFSGVAGENGEGLILPQTLIGGGALTSTIAFGGDAFGPFAVTGATDDGWVASGLNPFAGAADPVRRTEAFLTAGDIGWGIVPYVGAGIETTQRAGGVFQGMDRLLPLDGAVLRFDGIAGVSYELMPGLGAGIEYRVTGAADDARLAGPAAARDGQTIMMRLDLGF